MAVGKGSMARASKAAAAKKVDVKATVVDKVEEAVVEAVVAEVKEEAPKAPTTKKCPYCMSEIAIEATRCPHCTSQLED